MVTIASSSSPSPPSSRRTSASAARKSAVLEAALAAFEELGYDATTIEDIRARSGASTGSIYHHFGSKEGVAAALYLEAISRYREGLRRRVARAKSARGLVRGIVTYHVDWAVAHPAWAKYLLFMRRTPSVRSVDAELRADTAAFLREMVGYLAPHVAGGRVRELPAALYAPLIIGPAQEVLRQWGLGRFRSGLAEMRDALADAAWRAVAERRRSPGSSAPLVAR